MDRLYMDEVTATRETQTQSWKDLNAQIDWMVAPGMSEYVNGLVSGRSLADGGHWSLHALRQHVAPLAERRGCGLSMLSLGCGDGHIEAALIQQFDWPVTRVVGLEYDNVLREAAAARFATIDDVKASFTFFDFNKSLQQTITGPFDLVFCCHALHHATDLEGTLAFINGLMAEESRFIGIEYLGPTRFQIEHDVLPHIQALFALLPTELRRNLAKNGAVEDQFRAPTIAEVRDADISESVRSSDLRTLLLSSFPIKELRPMGGTLLRWLLQYRSGNFRYDDESHVAIIRLLQIVERQMIESGQIRSDDLFFVLSRSDRLDKGYA